jgi:hypothetical protein
MNQRLKIYGMTLVWPVSNFKLNTDETERKKPIEGKNHED